MKAVYIVVCPECNNFFAMTEIKSDYKMCPRCGNKIKWRSVPRQRRMNFEEAKRVAIYLNDQRAMSKTMSVKELLQSLKEDETE